MLTITYASTKTKTRIRNVAASRELALISVVLWEKLARNIHKALLWGSGRNRNLGSYQGRSVWKSIRGQSNWRRRNHALLLTSQLDRENEEATKTIKASQARRIRTVGNRNRSARRKPEYTSRRNVPIPAAINLIYECLEACMTSKAISGEFWKSWNMMNLGF